MEKSRKKQLSLLRGARRQSVTRWQRRFLQCLRISPNVAAACAAARISRQTAYRKREQDPEFAAKWQEAIDFSLEELEAVAFKSAKVGDSQLLSWLLWCHRPLYPVTPRTEHAFTSHLLCVL